jgi:hypothetical protein
MPTPGRRRLGILALVAPALTLAAAPPGDIKPCELLTPAQVATVLPKFAPGWVAANGESLITGVKSYQCSYIDPATNGLTVIVTVAVDDAAFEKIAPSKSMHEDHRQVVIGDRGWVFGEEDDLKVAAVKGRTLIDLELMAPGAGRKADALVELARAVAKKV